MNADGIVAAVVDECSIISCYCSPSRKLSEFLVYLDVLEGILTEVRTPGRGVIIAGDLNAKSPAWGGTKSDRRGNACMDLLARHGLVPIKLKERFTFHHRNKGASFIDVMSTDRTTARWIRKSEVLGHFSFSDHRYVCHTIGKPKRGGRGPGVGPVLGTGHGY